MENTAIDKEKHWQFINIDVTKSDKHFRKILTVNGMDQNKFKGMSPGKWNIICIGVVSTVTEIKEQLKRFQSWNARDLTNLGIQNNGEVYTDYRVVA